MKWKSPKGLKATFFYLFLLFIPLCWWLLFIKNTPLFYEKPPLPREITHLVKRETLQLALQGDVPAMLECSEKYYERYRVLDKQGIRAHSPNLSQLIERLREYSQLPFSNQPTYIAQTYTAATIGLAISDPGQIIAIPEPVRSQLEFHSKEKMDQVLHNSSRYNAEILFGLRPKYCFVASYTAPTTLETLKKQDIKLIFLDDINSTFGILRTIRFMGKTIQQSEKADLLALFTEATWLALKNEFILLKTQNPEIIQKKIAFLFYYDHFSIPSDLYIARRWLEQLDLHLVDPREHSSTQAWTIPMQIQDLLPLELDEVIVACNSPSASYNRLLGHKGFKELLEQEKLKLLFIEDQAIHSPTQIISIGFYDLLCCIYELTDLS